MNTLFVIQLITSFLVGGLFIALQTLIAERVPLFWRGIVLTIPSTMAMGLLFIGLSKSPIDAVQAISIMPLAEGICYAYLLIFILFTLKFNLIISIIGSLTSWAIFAFLALKFTPENFWIAMIYLIIIIIFTYPIINKQHQNTHLKAFPLNWKHISLRAFLSGIIIFLAVLLSKILGNTWGGLFSTFPAVFTSTLTIYYHLQGKTVLPAVGKSLYFPGVFVFVVYMIMVMITFPRFGIWLGTLFSYLGVFIFLAIWTFITKKHESATIS